MHKTMLGCLPLLLTAPLFAQPQIGAATCSSSTLNGVYSLSLSGRDVSSTVTFSNVLQGIGTATFDGLSKVTFTFTANKNSAFGVATTWSGTYSIQANCLGAVNITTGDTVTFILGAFAQGQNYFISGQDGVLSLFGNGNTVPASCTAGTLNGTYSFNGNGFPLASTKITGVNSIQGLITFDGTSAITPTTTWYSTTTTAAFKIATLTGTYTVTTGCTATATATDANGNIYSLTFTITDTNGNFIIGGTNSTDMFVGTGRVL